MTQGIPSSHKPRILRAFQPLRRLLFTLLSLLPTQALFAEQITVAALPPHLTVPTSGDSAAAPDDATPAPAEASTPAETPALTELRRQSIASVAALLATRTDPFSVDMLIDNAPKLIELVKVDAEGNLHYKQFGRPGTIAFADLTVAQLSGLLTALLTATGDDPKEAPTAHLQAGLLNFVLGKQLESSAEIAKALELNPDLEPIVAERLKTLPQPQAVATTPVMPLAGAAGAGADAIGAATGVGDTATVHSGWAGQPGGARATELSIAPTANSWPPKEPPIPAGKRRFPGLYAPVGPTTRPNCVDELRIDKPGIYENYLVDGRFQSHNLVTIKANNVVFRNSEIRNSCYNGVQVYAKDVLIENCRIHHLVNGSEKASLDAHGITGCPTRLVVRNCAIYQFSGDGLQFDPTRNDWNDVLIEHCDIWLEPLDIAIAGWKKGQTPGENALDTKTPGKGRRARVIIRNSVFHGFIGSSATAGIRSALNLKENIDATIENCVFYDNDLGLRLRGPGEHGGARVSATDCYFYRGADAIRYEDKIQGLTLTRMAFSADIQRRYDKASLAARDLRITGDTAAPALQDMLPPQQR